MEYIPDGLTKSQWEAIKRKEAEDLKAKGNLGALGTTKFKSRSFEAWQKAGGKHLFPVNPKEVPYEERPYMQRKDGDWEGLDLTKKGLKGTGQGVASKRLAIDDVYEGAQAEGKLNSVSIFGGASLPWTSKQAADLNNKGAFNPDGKQGARGVAGKQLTEEQRKKLEKNLVKVIDSKKKAESPAASKPAPAPEKKLFGLF